MQIKQPGMLLTLQDFGRYGYLAQGITRGGPADALAFLWGNRLLGNSYHTPQLELTLGGLQAVATQATHIAVCGATIDWRINGIAQPQWQVVPVRRGDQLEFGYARAGVRAYIAVAGGFAVPAECVVKGSVSTVTREQQGGTDGHGHPVQSGEQLHYAQPDQSVVVNQRVPARFIPHYPSAQAVADAKPLQLTATPGMHYHALPSASQQQCWQQSYEVTPASDRMGVRLKPSEDNPPLGWPHAGILSLPLGKGTLQLPPSNEPVVMLADAQTLGGYPQLLQLTWESCNMLAQTPPGHQVQFNQVTVEAAEASLVEYFRFFGVACQQADNLRS